MPRLYRESPLNSIWEGSGNVNCLDVLRAMAKEPLAVEAFFDELTPVAGMNPHLDAAANRLRADLADQSAIEMRARHIVERMAQVLQGALLLRHSGLAVAEAFCAAWLGDAGGWAFGTLPTNIDVAAIIQRAWPETAYQ